MLSAANLLGRRLRVRGQVQGVGFRPHVWRLAGQLGLVGEVRNDAGGVTIEVFGGGERLSSFIRRLRSEAPPLAHIDDIVVEPLAAIEAPERFSIGASRTGHVCTGVVPDAAVCEACRDEILAPEGRRRGYAFTNCTDCGPRYSIVGAIPYDRPNTSMRDFGMCEVCAAEYRDPSDRRFHAQPIACPSCGPRLWFVRSDGMRGRDAVVGREGPVDAPRAGNGVSQAGGAPPDPIEQAARVLFAGEILALKGLGGFHLACDATNPAAVGRLRSRKHRPAKPFALMMADLAEVRRHCVVSAREAGLLTSPAAPIVLLRRRDAQGLDGVAPGVDRLGVMLPHTPLHLLLLRLAGRPLVMTSGNRSLDPPETDNEGALTALAEIADGFLLHDRGIVNRVDDSVVRVEPGGPETLRRARGYAPAPMSVPAAGTDAAVLAAGAQSRVSFCFARDGQALLSPHIGDLSGTRVLADYERQIRRLEPLFGRPLSAVIADEHPDYASRRFAERLAGERGLPLVTVQHHHAHFAACAAENGLPLRDGPALGLVLDGSGWGGDGTLWGGEFLLADYAGYRRVGHFDAVPMPGGDRAATQPWRNVVGHLHAAFGRGSMRELGRLRALAELPSATVSMQLSMIERGVNAPRASSAGRLFDAVAAVLGIAPLGQDYEGEAPIRLEAMAARAGGGHGAYACELIDGERLRFVWRPLWEELLGDLHRGVPSEIIASRFHQGLVRALVHGAASLAARHGVQDVVLSGGVMHNAVLLEGLRRELSKTGLRPHWHSRLPAGDGGLSLGQAVIGLHRAQRGALSPPARRVATSAS